MKEIIILTYVCYVDDIIYAGNNVKDLSAILENLKYNLKGVRHPNYHLGGNFKRFKDPEKMLTWGELT